MRLPKQKSVILSMSMYFYLDIPDKYQKTHIFEDIDWDDVRISPCNKDHMKIFDFFSSLQSIILNGDIKDIPEIYFPKGYSLIFYNVAKINYWIEQNNLLAVINWVLNENGEEEIKSLSIQNEHAVTKEWILK